MTSAWMCQPRCPPAWRSCFSYLARCPLHLSLWMLNKHLKMQTAKTNPPLPSVLLSKPPLAGCLPATWASLIFLEPGIHTLASGHLHLSLCWEHPSSLATGPSPNSPRPLPSCYLLSEAFLDLPT